VVDFDRRKLFSEIKIFTKDFFDEISVVIFVLGESQALEPIEVDSA